MILITENAEMKLQKALYNVREKKAATKCIKIKYGEKQSDDLLKIVKVIDDVIDDPDGIIFDCEDDEIFILAHGITAKGAERLNTILKKEITQQSPAQNVEPAIVFDPAVQWKALMDHVENKIFVIEKRALEQKQKIEQEKKERLRQIVLNMPIEKELVQTLEKKRQEREKIGIAIIEDDTFTRNLVTNTLKASYEMTAFGDGYSAVAKYAGRAPDILFLDIDLPDVNGLDLLKKILSIDPKAYVVMLSGNSQRENIMKAVESGAKGFIGKPFTKEKLLQYIQKCPRFKELETNGVKA